jgi:hypothetical protein
MKLDGSISNDGAFWILLGALLVFGILAARRNPRPPVSQFRRDGGMPFIAPWNVLSEEKLTPAAIGYYRTILKQIPLFLVAVVLGWLLLDAIL